LTDFSQIIRERGSERNQQFGTNLHKDLKKIRKIS
jgi:hypothetical protein